MKRKLFGGVGMLLGLASLAATANAATFNSSNFTINGSIGDSIAGSQSSTSYQMVATGGESVAGESESLSYKLGQGYTSRLAQSFELQLSADPVAIGTLTPGVSKTSMFDLNVLTDAAGYTLAINQNQPLTSGGNTISAISGSIGSPIAWNEGVTKGLGFTLTGTNATALPGTWNSGNNYAAIPSFATSFYTRTGFSGGAQDTLSMRVRLDTPLSQTTGNYTNQVTVTGTITP